MAKSGWLLVGDEDYKGFGLSGELAAVLAEAEIKVKYGLVCTEEAIPYSRAFEGEALPNTRRIVDAVLKLM